MKSYGAVGDGNHDDAAAIQAAIDSGKTTVYLPFGNYFIGSEIIVRSNVCLLRGFGSTLTANGGYPSLQVQNTSCTSVTIETLNGGRLSDAGDRGGSTGTVVLRDFDC